VIVDITLILLTVHATGKEVRVPGASEAVPRVGFETLSDTVVVPRPRSSRYGSFRAEGKTGFLITEQ
jgi:hypothetical protein